MPMDRAHKYIVVGRDDFSGWCEARSLLNLEAKQIADFIWEDIICRHGLFGKLVVDGGTENMGEVIDILNLYGIHRIQVSAYHPMANGMIERGHRPLTDGLSKMIEGEKDGKK